MIVQITDKLLYLQQAGHPQYVEWSRTFVCNIVTHDDLKKLNDQLKMDLQNWRKKVSSLRKKIYALNYFTCLQLLRISNEFHCLINNPNHEISNEIFMLLMSLSPNLTVEKIKEVTSIAGAQEIAFKNLPKEIDKLNKAQKETYVKSVQEYELNPRMVLAAIHLYGSNEEKVIEWCLDPKNQEMFESIHVVSEDSIKLNVSEVDIINTIQELIELEFSESLAIEAFQKYGDDISNCIDYCINKTLNDDANTSYQSEAMDGRFLRHVFCLTCVSFVNIRTLTKFC